MLKLQRKISIPVYILFIIVLFGVVGISYSIWGNASVARGTEVSDVTGQAMPEVTKVVWWHSMGGENGKVVDKLVTNFNAVHNDIKVEAVYQGSYYDSLTKLKASFGSKIGPTLAQVYDIGTKFMIDSKAITPMQQFIQQENYDTSQLDEAIMNHYVVDDTLYSMPFNASNSLLYYNKDMFKAAGLNPEKPPLYFDEVGQAARKLSRDNAWGAYFGIQSWYMEQFVANQGAELVNFGNGREGLATAWQLNGSEGVKVLTWWKELVDSKAAVPAAGKSDESKKWFIDGKVAMILDTTASLRDILNGVNGRFEVGTGFFPKAPGDKGSIMVGGGSNWIMNNKSDAEQKAAWTFIKFISEPEQQAFFHVNTGYFPITKAAYDQPLVKENLAQFPQFGTAIDQHQASEMSRASQGGVLGVYPDARKLTENAVNEALSGVKTPQEALDAAAAAINAKIAAYNSQL
ncbi:ABC transporter substrate-binding protein [Paenibacillus whitsoniae]|uniref:ABC transporter substrate-binding protein n=1 Tax=Paenibacillus whitsoniae TaxID=2496558 RepID=A0A430JFK1_9BACL|nr:ABC transporter substrate-binding protein [Paenibacillus whitsoniae]RTE09819.1 ABC transporter substrate-binding protein [Paenibacillus whitsoniae]